MLKSKSKRYTGTPWRLPLPSHFLFFQVFLEMETLTLANTLSRDALGRLTSQIAFYFDAAKTFFQNMPEGKPWIRKPFEISPGTKVGKSPRFILHAYLLTHFFPRRPSLWVFATPIKFAPTLPLEEVAVTNLDYLSSLKACP